MSKFISLLKKLPFDVGQAERKHTTAAKRIAFSFVPSGQGKTALDIGCRDGYWSERLKEKGYVVISLDVLPEYPGALTVDVETGLPFPDRSFDVIWCTEIIEHLRNPEFLIREVSRVIRPGGMAVFTTPNSHCWFYYPLRLFGYIPAQLQNPDHKQFFSKKHIKEIAKGYRIFGYFPYIFFFLKISRLIGLLSPTLIFVKKF